MTREIIVSILEGEGAEGRGGSFKIGEEREATEVQATIVVTGGAGFIGSALIRQLIRETDATVVNLDKLTYAGDLTSLAECSESPRYYFEHHDICDTEAVRRIFERYKPTAVVHLAAESHEERGTKQHCAGEHAGETPQPGASEAAAEGSLQSAVPRCAERRRQSTEPQHLATSRVIARRDAWRRWALGSPRAELHGAAQRVQPMSSI